MCPNLRRRTPPQQALGPNVVQQQLLSQQSTGIMVQYLPQPQQQSQNQQPMQAQQPQHYTGNFTRTQYQTNNTTPLLIFAIKN